MVAKKKSVAATAVERDRKFAEPEAPKMEPLATAEGSTEVGAFTVLQQDQNDHGDRGDDLHHDCDGDQHGGHLYYFPLTQKWF